MSFKSNLLNHIDSYVNFKIVYMLDDGTKVRRYPDIPYEYGAKNTPSQIESAIIGEPSNWDGDILKSDSELEIWMNSNKDETGIDCSGFVYYVLNEATYGAVMDQFDKTYANGVSARDLTNTYYGSLITKAKDMVAGCTIRTDDGKHVLVIYDVIKNSSGVVTEIKYAHSNGSHGPHKGYITIGNENEDLNGPSQTWNDVAYTPGVAKSLYDQTILLDSLQ